MSPTRRHPRAAIAAAILLPVLTPGAIALAGNDPGGTTPAVSGPAVLVAEQVSTARSIVPFGWARAGSEAPQTMWAFGRTRPASTYAGSTPVEPSPSTPAAAVLLTGTAKADDQPTAWRRADEPVDAAGAALRPGTWRPADGTTNPPTAVRPTAEPPLHIGGVTPTGAAALLVRIAPGSGAAREAVLARTTDGRFHELPAPPADLVAPAPDAFTGAASGTVPVAVADARPDPDHGDRGRTSVLLAPAGGDGVLRWDGAAWSEEPWQDAAGAPTGPHTALALQATPAGDSVALFGGDPTAPDAARVELARRDGAAGAFRTVEVGPHRLLNGALPSGVRSIHPVDAPGQPLTISAKHWWVDLIVTRSADGVPVSATVHLKPSPVAPEPGTSPSTPATQTTSTPVATTPSTATPTGAWCTPELNSGAGCAHALGFRFATARGYTSGAFDGGGATLGERAISSPVIPESPGDTAAREASASGGFLELTGDTFALRAGVGDDGTGHTQAAVFGASGAALVGGDRAIGRTMPKGSEDTDALEASDGGFADQYVDVAMSPPGTPADEQGAIMVDGLHQFVRQIDDGPWAQAYVRLQLSGNDREQPVSTALAWPAPDLVIVAGNGLLYETVPPVLIDSVSGPARNIPKADVIDAASGLRLLDVAATSNDAWAVGLDGAALHRTQQGWTRGTFAAGLNTPDMLSVAYAGRQALIASSAGLLSPNATGRLVRDQALAALLSADGRPARVSAVAGLPDGAAVVDGRYVRLTADGPWQRLASPAEGDVVALTLWRDDAPTGSSPDGATTTSTTSTPLGPDDLGNLRIAASVADVARPVVGSEFSYAGPTPSSPPVVQGLPANVSDGRVAELTPSGWVDRLRVPLAPSAGRDLAAWSPPVASLATRANGDGWAVGGSGSYGAFSTDDQTSSPVSFSAALGASPFDASPDDVISERAFVSVDEAGKGAASGTPTGPVGVRLLIGGHPACLDECAGRADQTLAPDANVQDAFETARGLKAASPQTPPVMVIGGGRGGGVSAPLSEAGAQRYADLLDEGADIPTAVAIGTGDVATPASRHAFASIVGSGVRHPTASIRPVPDPAPPASFARTDTVAYAFDVLGPNTVERVVVIDNAGGVLRGGPRGDQAQWLTAVLAAPQPTVVVGAARLDEFGPGARDAEEELSLLRRAEAYVATDGPEEATDPRFGARTAAEGVSTVGGGHVQVYRTSGLAHMQSNMLQNLSYRQNPERRDPDLDAGQGIVSLLQLDGSTSQDPSVVPVLHHLSPSIPYQGSPATVGSGQATFVPVFGTGRGGTGIRAKRSAFTVPRGSGMDLPEPVAGTTPVETTPEPTDDDVLVDSRSSPYVYVDALPCRTFGTSAACERQLPIDGRFETDDASVAVFVRSVPPKKGTNGPPIIPTDEHGDPIPDSSSSLLCPLKPGRAIMTITSAGRRMRYPLRVVAVDASNPSPGANPKAPCAFQWEPPSKPKPEAPAPTTPVAPPVPVPQPEPRTPVLPHHPPVVAPVAPVVAFLPPMGAAAQAQVPPVAANPKPVAPPAPPAPPSGISAQQVPVQQGVTLQQSIAVTQEERRTEVAREGADYRASVRAPSRPGGQSRQPTAPPRGASGSTEARSTDAPAGRSQQPADPTIYRSTPASAVPLLAGGLLALLAAGAGGALGLRRKRSRSRSRRWQE